MDNDRSLLEHGPSERAVVHRLTVYLEDEFPCWHIDCEYNRQGGGTGRKRATLAIYGDASNVDPDIIIHRRGPDGPNLLALEVKPKSRTEADKEHDRNKLRGYLADHKYAFAALVIYETGDGSGFAPPERIT